MDNCFTRLRVTVNDPAFVKEQALKALPCSGVVQSGCDVQIVWHPRAGGAAGGGAAAGQGTF